MFQVACVIHGMLEAEDWKPNCISERSSHLPEISHLVSGRVQQVQEQVCPTPQCPPSISLSSLVCCRLIELSVGRPSSCR